MKVRIGVGCRMKISRRSFLSMSDPSAVMEDGMAGASPGAPAPPASLEVHAANRLMFGPRSGDISQIASMGYDAFLAEQLNPGSIDDSYCDFRLGSEGFVTFNENRQQLYDRRDISGENSRPIRETIHATWLRMLFSRRQLYERVVEFWHNHFSIYGWDYIIRSMWPDWDKLIRTHALGNFRAMIEATTKHPCMLYYLDNYISTNAGPNENYSRELFELHTLGAMNYQSEGGYIDQDVYETSRCFTGWTFDRGSSSATRGEFLYNHNNHDRFIKLVLGQLIMGDQPAMKDGNDVLDLIAYHPGTALHIATKLATRFIGPTASPAIIQSTADVFYANRYAANQIQLTLAHLLASEEFKNTRMTKFKRPVEWVASTCRVLFIDYTTDSTWDYLYDRMGMPMFGWRTPEGAPDEMAAWLTSNNLMQRWNWIFRIASWWYDDDGLLVPTDGLKPDGINTPAGIAQFWLDLVHQRGVSEDTRDAVTEFVADGRSWSLPLPADMLEEKNHFCAALCAMTPEFMMM
jgi:uncharacterized protein (DUF1800 family)